MSVTLLEVLAAAGARQACLTGENSGFVALCLAQSLASGPRNVGLGDVVLTPEGDVCVLSGPKATATECEMGLRKLLRQLLVGAHRPARTVLRIAEMESRGLSALTIELSGALVPLNRPAARRSIARLCRDTERAQQRGLLETPRAQVEALLAGWVGEKEVLQAKQARTTEPPAPAVREEVTVREEATVREAATAREEATVPQPRVRRTLDLGAQARRNDQTPFLGTQVVTMMERHQKTDPSLFGTLEVRPEHRGGVWSENSAAEPVLAGAEAGQAEAPDDMGVGGNGASPEDRDPIYAVAPEDVDIFHSLAPGDVQMLEPTPPPVEIAKSHLDALLCRFNAALQRSDQAVRHDLKGMCDVELTPHTDAWLSSLTPPPVAAEITEKPAAAPDVTPKGGFVVALLTILVMGGAFVGRYHAELADVAYAAAGRSGRTPQHLQVPVVPKRAKAGCHATLNVRGVAALASVTVRPANASSPQISATKAGPNPSFDQLRCGEPLEVIVARVGQSEPSWRRIPVPAQSLTPTPNAGNPVHTLFAD